MYTFVATSEDNNARYRCEAMNQISIEPMKAEIVLSVQCKILFITFFVENLRKTILSRTMFFCVNLVTSVRYLGNLYSEIHSYNEVSSFEKKKESVTKTQRGGY